MTLNDYTSYDQVRAVLGISDDELEDSTLGLDLYIQLLEMDLSDVYVDLPDLYKSLLEASSRTSAEKRLVNVTQVFAGYSVAKTLLTSATLFAPKKIDDGKASLERVADPFERLRDDINNAYTSIRNRLIAAVDAVIPNPPTRAATTFSLFAVAPLSIDPVTNE